MHPNITKLKKKIITTKESIKLALVDVDEQPELLVELDNTFCAICQDIITPNQKIVMTECLHPLHLECMDLYLQQNYNNCPVCRKAFPI